MGRPVVLTRQAERDLTEIVRYITRDNPVAAERFGLALLTRANGLSLQPQLGTPVRGWKGVRALLHRHYYIVYLWTAEASQIEVLRFWHSARDLGVVKLRDTES